MWVVVAFALCGPPGWGCEELSRAEVPGLWPWGHLTAPTREGCVLRAEAALSAEYTRRGYSRPVRVIARCEALSAPEA